jgi:CHAD domain-containing protein
MAIPGKWIARIEPKSRVSDVAETSLQARLAAVQHQLPLAALSAHEDVEYVHRLRVATRRAVAALKLYKDFLPPRKSAALKRLLSGIRRASGAARDLDVLALRLDAADGDQLSFVRGEIARRRTEAQADIKNAFDAATKEGTLLQLTYDVLGRVRPRSKPDKKRRWSKFAPWAEKQLHRSVKRFFKAQPAELTDVAALHQFRIEGKSLRYVMELLMPAFPAEFRDEHYPRVEAIQKKLGAINDHVTGISQFQTWSELAAADEERQLLQQLAGREQSELTAAVAEFSTWWTDKRAAALRAALLGEPPADDDVVTMRRVAKSNPP